MKNNLLTIVIPLYSVDIDIELLKNRIFYQNDLEILFINDNPHLSQENSLNNKFNFGKYYSIIFNLENIKTKYFLTVDPDDILNGGIDWSKLLLLSEEIKKFEDADFFVNSYWITKKGKTNFKKSSNINVFFNPNLIFNKDNILKIRNEMNITFDGQKITYFDDVLFLLMCLTGKRNDKNVNVPFYNYLASNGITSDWRKSVDEIISAKKMMDQIIYFLKNNGISIPKKIIRYRVARVKILNKKSLKWKRNQEKKLIKK